MSLPAVVCIRKAELNKRNYKDFKQWSKKKDHLYIGRNMEFYVPGTKQSIWHNPFTSKKYGSIKCLELYEKYIREMIEQDPEIYNLEELLEMSEIGCWCINDFHHDKEIVCHGQILIKLMKENYIL